MAPSMPSRGRHRARRQQGPPPAVQRQLDALAGAAHSKQPEVVNRILKEGAYAAQLTAIMKTSKGSTPLHAAAQSGSLEIATTMLADLGERAQKRLRAKLDSLIDDEKAVAAAAAREKAAAVAAAVVAGGSPSPAPLQPRPVLGKNTHELASPRRDALPSLGGVSAVSSPNATPAVAASPSPRSLRRRSSTHEVKAVLRRDSLGQRARDLARASQNDTGAGAGAGAGEGEGVATAPADPVQAEYDRRLALMTHEYVASLVDVRDDTGRTPLSVAAKWGHPEVCAALIAAGANVHIVNDNDRTPVHDACETGHHEVWAHTCVLHCAAVPPRDTLCLLVCAGVMVLFPAPRQRGRAVDGRRRADHAGDGHVVGLPHDGDAA